MDKTISKMNSKSSLHETRIDLSARSRSQLVHLLNASLADTFDLYSQVKYAHWNVKGPQFYQLHLLFDEIAGQLLEYVDELAERVTTLGGTAAGSVRMAAKESRLEEYPPDVLDGLDHVAALAARFGEYCRLVRANIRSAAEMGDDDSADMFTEISRAADKRLWLLEAHLQSE